MAARLQTRNAASTKNSTRLAVVLACWFFTSAMFNDATPRLMRTLEGSGGTNLDVTALELAVTISIAATKLVVEKARPLPPASVALPVLGIGASHLLGCRLFIWSLQFIPVSIAQTIRAANPVVTVAFAVTALRQPLPPASVLLTLLVLIFGFALAVSSGPGTLNNTAGDTKPLPSLLSGLLPFQAGVAASVGSVCCLTLTNTFSKRLLSSRVPILPSELQCWICIAALTLLAPFWVFSGGAPRLLAAFTGPSAADLGKLLVWDGALYFSEQILQFAALSMLSSLTLSVVDTTRRLFIVVVAGFVLQGDPVTPLRVIGALVVYLGAAAYAWTTSEDTKAGSAAAKAKQRKAA